MVKETVKEKLLAVIEAQKKSIAETESLIESMMVDEFTAPSEIETIARVQTGLAWTNARIFSNIEAALMTVNRQLEGEKRLNR